MLLCSSQITGALFGIHTHTHTHTHTRTHTRTHTHTHTHAHTLAHTHAHTHTHTHTHDHFNNVYVFNKLGDTTLLLDQDDTRLPVCTKLAYAVGAIPYAMCNTVAGFYLSIFLLEVVIVSSVFKQSLAVLHWSKLHGWPSQCHSDYLMYNLLRCGSYRGVL